MDWLAASWMENGYFGKQHCTHLPGRLECFDYLGGKKCLKGVNMTRTESLMEKYRRPVNLQSKLAADGQTKT